MKIIITKEYTLEEKDVCLNYCYHRLTQHNKTFSKVEEVKRLKEEIAFK